MISDQRPVCLDGLHVLGDAVIGARGRIGVPDCGVFGRGHPENGEPRVFPGDLFADLGGAAVDRCGLRHPARPVIDVEQARKGDGHIILQIRDIGVVADQFFGDLEGRAVVPLGSLPLPGGLAARAAVDMGAEQGTTV